MKSFAVAMPFPAGKVEEWQRFANEVQGPRLTDHDQSRRGIGLTKEICWIQNTPMGDFFILYLEGDDPVRANQQFAASNSPYDRWFKEQAGSILEADFSQPIPVHPELVVEWDAPNKGTDHHQHFASVFPILPGKSEALRSLGGLIEERAQEHQASRQRMGISMERIWIQPTPGGDVELGYFEAEDIGRVFQIFGSSQEPYDVWHRNFIQDTSGIDFSQPAAGPPPQMVLHWHAD